VVTTNLTRLMADLGEVLLVHDPIATARARDRAKYTW